MARSLEKFGDRFLQRVFCPAEVEYCRRMRDPVPHFAARFAAKEAVSKAFGCGIGGEIGLLDIEVIRDEHGAPGIRLHGNGLALGEARGVRRILISLSHTENYAVASVTLLG